MSDENGPQARRQAPRHHQRPVRHTKSSTRISKMARPTQLTSLTGEGAADRSEMQGQKSSDQLTRNWSSARLGKHATGAQARPRRSSNHNQGQGAQPRPKSVIQLEHSDSDQGNEFVDTDSEDDPNSIIVVAKEPSASALPRPGMPRRTSSGLSVTIHPVEPTPPQISNEVVISVTSMTDMAQALKGGRKASLGFVEEGDLVSNAVSHSQSSADLARIVGGSDSRTLQKQRLGQQRLLDYHIATGEHLSTVERREFERVLKEYINAKTLQNPVTRSLHRLKVTRSLSYASRHGSVPNGTHSPLSLHSKKVGALSATTVNQMANLSLDNLDPSSNNGPNGSSLTSGVSNYLVNRIWTQGWTDDDDPKEASASPESIHTAAQRAHQHMSQAQPKLQSQPQAQGGANWARPKRSNDTVKLV